MSIPFSHALHYVSNENVFIHFVQHSVFGLAKNIPRYNVGKNWVEKIGDLGLWTIENFPGKVWRLMKEPRWITLVLTQISLATVSFIFYPRKCIELKNVILLHLPLPTREAVKFALYLTIVSQIVSAALRAYGRFRNDQLMNAWYTNGHHLHPDNIPVATA